MIVVNGDVAVGFCVLLWRNAPKIKSIALLVARPVTFPLADVFGKEPLLSKGVEKFAPLMPKAWMVKNVDVAVSVTVITSEDSTDDDLAYHVCIQFEFDDGSGIPPRFVQESTAVSAIVETSANVLALTIIIRTTMPLVMLFEKVTTPESPLDPKRLAEPSSATAN